MLTLSWESNTCQFLGLWYWGSVWLLFTVLVKEVRGLVYNLIWDHCLRYCPITEQEVVLVVSNYYWKMTLYLYSSDFFIGGTYGFLCLWLLKFTLVWVIFLNCSPALLFSFYWQSICTTGLWCALACSTIVKLYKWIWFLNLSSGKLEMHNIRELDMKGAQQGVNQIELDLLICSIL